MLHCMTQDSLLAPWILESTPLLSCSVGDKNPATPTPLQHKASGPRLAPDCGIGIDIGISTGMKSGQLSGQLNGKLGLDEQDDDDIFGTNRSTASVGYGTSTTFCRVGTSARPTMISAKYRQKEERRKVLKISISKLKKIEDPESSLRRSVLINNTMKRLQREAREEKMQKQQAISSNFNRCFAADFFKDDENTIDQVTSVQSTRSTEQLVDITNLPEINNSVKTSPVSLMSKPSSTTTATTTVVTSMCLEDCLGCDETMPDVTDAVLSSVTSSTCDDSSPANRGAAGRKRSFDDVDDSDVQDVLSQFYMPPTPRMLTSIDDDEDEDVNVVDLDTPSEKRPRLDCEQSAAERLKNMTRCQSPCSSDIEQRLTMSSSGSDVISERSSSSGSSSFSCGHSSMFNELQSVVYHSLIASLET